MTEQKKPELRQWWFSEDMKQRVYIVGETLEGNVAFQQYASGRVLSDIGGWSDWHHEPDCTGWTWQPPDWVTQDREIPRDGVDEFCWLTVGEIPKESDWNTCFGFEFKKHGAISGGMMLHVRCLRKDLPPMPEVEEKWPKYYSSIEPKYYPFVRRISATHYMPVKYDGTDGLKTPNEWTDSDERRRAELTESEALARIVKPSKKCVMCNGPADLTDDSCKDCHEFAIDQVCGVRPDLRIFMTVDGILYCDTKPRMPLHKQVQFSSCGCFVVEVGE